MADIELGNGTSGQVIESDGAGSAAWGSLTKTKVGLSNVDNTSDAAKNAATATLTNKTLTSPVINTPTAAIITSLTAETTIDDADIVMIYDNSATALRKMTKANFVAGIGGSLTGVTNPASGQLLFNPGTTTYAIDIDRTSNTGDQLGIRLVSGDGSNLSANKALYILNAAEDRGVTHSYESSSSYAIGVDSSSYRVSTSGGVGGRDIRLQPGQADRLILPVKKDLTDNSTTSLYEIALPTLTGTGGVVKANVFASDGTDIQSRSQIVRYSAVNKAGTYTTEIVVVSEAISASTGTLSGTWSILTGSNKITIQFNGNSSLVPTTLWVHYTIESFSDQAITLL